MKSIDEHQQNESTEKDHEEDEHLQLQNYKTDL